MALGCFDCGAEDKRVEVIAYVKPVAVTGKMFCGKCGGTNFVENELNDDERILLFDKMRRTDKMQAEKIKHGRVTRNLRSAGRNSSYPLY